MGLSPGPTRLVGWFDPNVCDERTKEGIAFRQARGFTDGDLRGLPLTDGEKDRAQVAASHVNLVTDRKPDRAGGVNQLSEGLHLPFGAYLQHTSNRGLDERNPGFNALGPMAGLSWKFWKFAEFNSPVRTPRT